MENSDFLETHKEALHLLGFWHPIFKSTVIAAIEARYSPQVLEQYYISDIVAYNTEFLIKWNKRMIPSPAPSTTTANV